MMDVDSSNLRWTDPHLKSSCLLGRQLYVLRSLHASSKLLQVLQWICIINAITAIILITICKILLLLTVRRRRTCPCGRVVNEPLGRHVQ